MKSETKESDAADKADGFSEEVRRLPCRGCTAHCGLYEQCNGAPWRLVASNESSSVTERR